MSRNKIDLALAFLQSHPADAASILEQQPIELVADFIRELPHTYAAVVLEKMLPQYIAKLCKILPFVVSEAFLSVLPVGLVAAVLRHCKKDLRSQLIEVLPKKTKIATQLLLKYSETSVGAWMIPNAPVLPDDCTVEQARARIVPESGFLGVNAIQVVTRDRKLCGQVDIIKLFSSSPMLSIKSIMRENSVPIAGRVSLTAALRNPIWKHNDTVPVDNMSGELIGILRHMDLRNGLDRLSKNDDNQTGAGPIMGISEVYGPSLLEIFSTLATTANPKNTSGAEK